MSGSAVLGDFEITLVRDSTYWWDGGAMFGVVPKTLWSRKTAVDELNRVPLGFNCYIIQTGDHTVLIETGGGDKMDARFRERAKLPPSSDPLTTTIARHGIDPEAIDIVINSHLHWDHCSGNTVVTASGVVPAFPRARYFAPRAEWEHAHEHHIRDGVAYIDANYDPLMESGHLTLVEDGAEIVPGVRMHSAPGHNRGMMVVTAESGGRTFCFLSDMVPTAAHLQPTWIAAFDLFPLESIETRIRWLTRAAEREWLCGFAHDPECTFANISTDLKFGFILA
ncbi:MAG: beta-lactamase domain protein [Candidatus Solibacter sp.]|nr:beta-lactamase domain protein [Candidatus Solibacter sp.]